MAKTAWREHRLGLPDVELAWYETGQGPVTLWLHGGPGHDHQLLRPLAEGLAATARSVLFDQRGSGASPLQAMNADTLHVDRFIADIEALRLHLGVERLQLAGWAWGAVLGLYYALTYPQHIDRLALIAPGPIPNELLDVAGLNLQHRLGPKQQRRLHDIHNAMAAALEGGDTTTYRRLYRQQCLLTAPIWCFKPEAAARLLDTLLPTVDPWLMTRIERYVRPSVDNFERWSNVARIEVPVLVLYGYQDFQPITQAYMLREWLPQSQIRLLNACGHVPWLDQPDGCLEALRAFLDTG
jgi:proline iminopeptidase